MERTDLGLAAGDGGALFEVTLYPPGRGRWLRSTPEVLNMAEMEKIVVITDRMAA